MNSLSLSFSSSSSLPTRLALVPFLFLPRLVVEDSLKPSPFNALRTGREEV
ncbi:MAG: hypothetical protein N3D14_00230 [Aquificaceae bacterium]|nr:hypothetical protein [Aquificaceae bacterium]